MLFSVLGPVEVHVSSDKVVHLTGKAAAVTAALALAAPRPLEKGLLLALAWGERPTDVNVVESTVRTIRKKVELSPGQGIVTQGARYRLDAPTDLAQFNARDKQGDMWVNEGQVEEAAEEYAAALRLWRAKFPKELYESEDLRPYVDAFEHTRRGVQLKHLRALLDTDRFGELLGHAEQLLAEDPFWEEALEVRIEALYHQQGARTAGEACRGAIEMLRNEGIEPSAHLQELHRLVLNNEWLRSPQRVERRRIAGKPTTGEIPRQARSALSAELEVVAEPEEVAGPNTLDAAAYNSLRPDSVAFTDNLPPATYSHFIMRHGLWKQLAEATAQRLPIIALIGIGGTGKSSLAREFAAAQRFAQESTFVAVVWVSDRERPGTTTLGRVLDLIAYVTDHRGIAGLEPQLKVFEVTRMLRNIRTLVVIDNYETIEDQDLASWLRTVPEPSKVIITTIARPKNLGSYCEDIEVRGLTAVEAATFYTEAVRRLGLTDMAEDAGARDTLVSAANSNPRLIEWALGQVKRRGRSVQSLVEQISGLDDVDHVGERRRVDVVLQDLLRGSWSSMSESARLVLATATCFPYGVDADTIDEICARPPNFEDALEELCDLYFLSRLTYPGRSGSWYRVEPLAASRSDPEGMFQQVRVAWLDWCERFTERIGFCPGEIERLALLDTPGMRLNIEYALAWAMHHGRFDSVIAIARNVRYYYYVRGFWSSSPNVHLLRAEAARHANDAEAEFDALVYQLNIASKQENAAAVEQAMPRLQELLAQAERFDVRVLAEYRHAYSLYLLAEGRLQEAESGWRANLQESDVLGPENHNANVRWLAVCLARQGSHRYDEAMELFEWAREHAREKSYQRAEILIDLQIAELRLNDAATKNDLDSVRASLDRLRWTVEKVSDRRYEADLHRLCGQCARLLGDTATATAEFSLAADLYERLGLGRRAITLRAEVDA
ncbi:winged helix-turn-helix domain-containing protein [Micromonospora sp. H61]|uniref:AfsR/SARP family transcriptional regulator n=1 Tax=Micromonospora sp. H61 TaxID=2824888 RepID=UPI001B39AB3A|nr:BTAD domain-containing putative transcriptional regulator [Micromonospora sp. H61]MBQ0991672.1 winged helix-turn-helix domain-containing protein [Micromonospora sp. H61]